MQADEMFLRRAIALAWEARHNGEEPFGAVLVHNGAIVAEAYSREIALSDPTAHAEHRVIREYCQAANVITLAGYTLYSSTEPCAMCAGAIHWARLSRVVFSVPQTRLYSVSGGGPKITAAEIIDPGGRHGVDVTGPLLEDEGAAVFEGYTFTPKVARHNAYHQPRT